MSAQVGPATPRVVPGLLTALRQDLADADFTVDGVDAMLGPVAGAALHREQTLPADRVTGGLGTPLATLVRLFTLGRPVPADAVSTALPRTGTDGLTALGLAGATGSDPTGGHRAHGPVSAWCDLRPYGDESHQWWVASDLSELALGGPLPEHHVLGIGGASTTLAAWTPRPAVRAALDLGTGCGVQALHLFSHADAITATDLSHRALQYARFNAALNDVELDLAAGSLLAPVAGRRFNLIVSNPPFVITPRSGQLPVYEYRDAGRTGDDVVSGLVRSLGGHLAPGGIAQLLGNWEIPRGRAWTERPQEWLADTGLDAWVIQREVQDPAQYAEIWARDGGHLPGSPAFEDMYAAWLADFASRDVESIGFGIITLQRPVTERHTWTDLRQVTGRVAEPMGPTVLAGLRARTWLAEHGDAGVLSTAWRCAPDVTEERHGRPGAQDPSVIIVRQGGGLGRAVQVDTVTAAFVGVCDGELTAGQALTAIAALVGQDADEVRSRALPVVRDLIADGLLVS